MYPRNNEQLLKGKDSSLEMIRKNIAKKKTKKKATNKQTNKKLNNNNNNTKNKNGFNFRLSFFF